MGVAAILAVLLLPGSGRALVIETPAAPRRPTMGPPFFSACCASLVRTGQPCAAAARTKLRSEFASSQSQPDPHVRRVGFLGVLATAQRRARRLVVLFRWSGLYPHLSARLAIWDLIAHRVHQCPQEFIQGRIYALPEDHGCCSAKERAKFAAQAVKQAAPRRRHASGARALRSRANAATRSRRNRDAANTMLQAAHRFALHRLPR